MRASSICQSNELTRSFPLGFLGMTSTNSTPPSSHLYRTLLSETCYARIHQFGDRNTLG